MRLLAVYGTAAACAVLSDQSAASASHAIVLPCIIETQRRCCVILDVFDTWNFRLDLLCV